MKRKADPYAEIARRITAALEDATRIKEPPEAWRAFLSGLRDELDVWIEAAQDGSERDET